MAETPRPPRRAPGWAGIRVLALGHSNRPGEELVRLLATSGVATLADIRTVPRSRANPQFSREALARSLPKAGIRYVHVPELGGLRKPRPGSPNGGWRNRSFQGYADHMGTDEFRAGLEALRALGADGPVAIMCAEGVPWRCHRSLVADALFARGVVVEHVTGFGRTRPHRPTPFGVIRGRSVTYPPGPATRAPSAATRSSGSRSSSRGTRGRAPSSRTRTPRR